MQIKQRLPLLALVLLMTAPALMQQARAQSNMQSMSTPEKSSADKAMMVEMKKMQSEMMAAPVTGDADKDFVAMMIPHNEGAIEMAQVELRYGRDPELRNMATAIIAAQKEKLMK